MQCDEAVEAVASLASAQQPTDALQAAHVSSCLRCQAAVARDKRLIRRLRGLRTDGPAPDADLLVSVMGAVDAEAASIKSDRTRRLAYVGGAAATAGGIVIAIAARRVRSGVAIAG